jgi:hypothetical protein
MEPLQAPSVDPVKDLIGRAWEASVALEGHGIEPDLQKRLDAALRACAARPSIPLEQGGGEVEKPAGWSTVHEAHGARAEVEVCTGSGLHHIGHVVLIFDEGTAGFTLDCGARGRKRVSWSEIVNVWPLGGAPEDRVCCYPSLAPSPPIGQGEPVPDCDDLCACGHERFAHMERETIEGCCHHTGCTCKKFKLEQGEGR